ncbi:hypothetical protein PENSTE_c001G00695 [Penicillium steckii]|uniref:Uncharacterized protein n=1 Tax=Penicillium steckii TaxID=303698 RepID=A0A1V6TZW4_9EURO|nr:hypothetical protein PENSTE_c001G00695 [Penicillium steckii]
MSSTVRYTTTGSTGLVVPADPTDPAGPIVLSHPQLTREEIDDLWDLELDPELTPVNQGTRLPEEMVQLLPMSEILTGEANWHVWRRKVKDALTGLSMEALIDDEEIIPRPLPSDPNAKRWRLGSLAVSVWLISNIDEGMRTLLRTENPEIMLADQTWKFLKLIGREYGNDTNFRLTMELYSTLDKDYTDAVSFTTAFLSAYNDMREATGSHAHRAMCSYAQGIEKFDKNGAAKVSEYLATHDPALKPEDYTDQIFVDMD